MFCPRCAEHAVKRSQPACCVLRYACIDSSLLTPAVCCRGQVLQDDTCFCPCTGAIGRHIVVAFNIAWGVFILVSLCLYNCPQ